MAAVASFQKLISNRRTSETVISSLSRVAEPNDIGSSASCHGPTLSVLRKSNKQARRTESAAPACTRSLEPLQPAVKAAYGRRERLYVVHSSPLGESARWIDRRSNRDLSNLTARPKTELIRQSSSRAPASAMSLSPQSRDRLLHATGESAARSLRLSRQMQ